MTEETFTCARCGGTFVKGNSDADRDKEYEDNYPGFKAGPKVVVCGECYAEIVGEILQ